MSWVPHGFLKEKFPDIPVQKLAIRTVLDMVGNPFHLDGRKFRLEINAVSLVNLAAVHRTSS